MSIMFSSNMMVINTVPLRRIMKSCQHLAELRSREEFSGKKLSQIPDIFLHTSHSFCFRQIFVKRISEIIVGRFQQTNPSKVLTILALWRSKVVEINTN